MMVGILAILKAGGAYLPLDPGYPEERLAFVLEDARVNVLLTRSKILEQLPVSLIENRQSKIGKSSAWTRPGRS
jgi:non-ribosomal peptide synthetase component F